LVIERTIEGRFKKQLSFPIFDLSEVSCFEKFQTTNLNTSTATLHQVVLFAKF
jgi:hypothetical protein